MEWICCGFMTVRLYGTPPNSTELGRLYKIIKDNLQNVRIKKLDGKQAYCRYGMAGINGAIIVEAKVVKRKTKY